MMQKEIQIITGPMFAGKTTHLIKEYDRQRLNAGSSCLLLKPSVDTRYMTHAVVSHTRVQRDCELITTDWRATLNVPENVTHVFIDEVQFCDDLLEIIAELPSSVRVVYLAGLMFDCKQEPFGKLHDITANTVVRLTGQCAQCGSHEGEHTIQSSCWGAQSRRVGADGYFVACTACLQQI